MTSLPPMQRQQTKTNPNTRLTNLNNSQQRTTNKQQKKRKNIKKNNKIVQRDYPTSPNITLNNEHNEPTNKNKTEQYEWKTKISIKNKKEPMKQITEEMRQELNISEFKDKEQHQYSKEEKNQIAAKFESANLTIGLQPITKQTIEQNLKSMQREGMFTHGENHSQQINAATLQSAKLFFRDTMKIPREARDSIKIIDIWNSNKQDKKDWDILYLGTETYEDVSIVTYHAKNIVKVAEGQTQKKMLNYVPREFFARFDYLENLAKKIRKESKGQLQTNTRKGRLNFIFKICNKDNKDTLWKDITPSIIPAECPIFELNITKKQTQNVPK
jgi:hypothetical protein